MRELVLMAFVGLAAIWGAAEKAQAQGMTEQKVLQLEHDWENANVKADAAAVERLEAADFVFTAPDGMMTGKSDDLNDLKTGNFRADGIDLSDLKARVYGNAAVVTGKATLKNCKWRGKDISGDYRFTDVWAKVNGNWQVVASQSAAVSKQ
jgi:ketosteroid isomerase-like protein